MGQPTRVSLLKKGNVVEYKNGLWMITGTEHITPGNKRAIYNLTMKNVKTGENCTVRFSVRDTLEMAFLEVKEMEYLYQDGDHYCFMDTRTYDQITLSADVVGDLMEYIPNNAQVKVNFYDGKPITVDLSASVQLKVTKTGPGARGDTVSNVTKPAVLETGMEVNVPLHISEGDVVKVDTRTGEFVERVSGR